MLIPIPFKVFRAVFFFSLFWWGGHWRVKPIEPNKNNAMILMCTKLLVCETSVIRNLVVCALSDAVWFASEGKPINFITVEYQLITSILLTVCIV